MDKEHSDEADAVLSVINDGVKWDISLYRQALYSLDEETIRSLMFELESEPKSEPNKSSKAGGGFEWL